MKIEITYNDRGQLKCSFLSTLYNINQDVKKISEEYYLDLDSGSIIYKGKRKGIVGEHISVMSKATDAALLKETFGYDNILMINSDALYVLFQTSKKSMKYITIQENSDKLVVALDDGNLFYIGRIIKQNHVNYDKIKNNISNILEYHEPVIGKRTRFTEFNDSQVERICESILKCVMNDFHIRLTKQIVPGINGKFPVSIFLDIERIEKQNEEEICNMYISQDRKMVSHFHIYRIIKY